MSAVSANELHDALQETLSPENLAIIRAEPGLAWQVEELQKHLGELGELVGYVPLKDITAPIRARLAQADAVHDDGHRFLYMALSAFEHHGPPAEREQATAARMGLFPEGLASTQISFYRQVTEAQDFHNRLEDPQVAPGLALLRAHVPAVTDALKSIAAAVTALREGLAELRRLEVEAVAAPKTRELFAARRAALSSMSTFASNVEHVLRGDDPETSAKRTSLLSRWHRALAEAAARAAASDAPTLDLITAPTPAPTA